MNPIQSQLQSIKNYTKQIEVVLENYNMGNLTVSEFLSQVESIALLRSSLRIDIMNEYNINENAINLMLTF